MTMASTYPGSLDNFAESSPSYMSDPDTTGRTHEARHNDVESAVEAIETALGALPPRFRFDETVGRRLFATDKNNANREQMVYGDTGWREVTPNPAIVSGAEYCRIRRIGSVVYFDMRNFGVLSSAAAGTELYQVPTGFRPNGVDALIGWCDSKNVAIPAWGSLGVWNKTNYDTVNPLNSIHVSWTCPQSWPTSLPGSASGTIPTADTLLPDDSTPDVDPDIPTGLTE